MRTSMWERHDRRASALARRAAMVLEHVTLGSAGRSSDYYVCPRCGILLEREFVPFCDQCGQRLRWSAVEARQAGAV